MKNTTITIIKDLSGLAFVVWVLYEPSISNWWTIFGIFICSGDYEIKD